MNQYPVGTILLCMRSDLPYRIDEIYSQPGEEDKYVCTTVYDDNEDHGYSLYHKVDALKNGFQVYPDEQEYFAVPMVEYWLKHHEMIVIHQP